MRRFQLETECLELAEQQGGWIRVCQAQELGCHPQALRRIVRAGRWRKLYPGVLAPAGSPVTWETSLRAAVAAAGVDAVASHRAAARTHCLPGFAQDVIEISTLRCLRWEGVTFHRLAIPRADRSTKDRLAVTTPTRTLIDVGTLVSLKQLEAALDASLIAGTTSIPYLEKRLNDLAGRGKNGVGPIRRLLQTRTATQAPTESELERLFIRRIIRRRRLRAPTIQFPVTIEGQDFRIDFSYPDVRLGIELLGWQFHGSPHRWERDLSRHNLLTNDGWTILYFTWTDITKRPDWVATEIRGSLARLGALSLNENVR